MQKDRKVRRKLTIGNLNGPSGRTNAGSPCTSADAGSSGNLRARGPPVRRTQHSRLPPPSLISPTRKGGVSRTLLHSTMRRTPSHLSSRLRRPDCWTGHRFCPPTPTTCLLTSHSMLCKPLPWASTYPITPSVHAFFILFYLCRSSLYYQSFLSYVLILPNLTISSI
jgi:hypothetical protein